MYTAAAFDVCVAAVSVCVARRSPDRSPDRAFPASARGTRLAARPAQPQERECMEIKNQSRIACRIACGISWVIGAAAIAAAGTGCAGGGTRPGTDPTAATGEARASIAMAVAIPADAACTHVVVTRLSDF